jgi:hypothetical protein
VDASNDGTVRIRRPWAEELAWLAISLVVAVAVIARLDKSDLIPFYAAYLVGYLIYNRRMGLDLTPTVAVLRRPYRRTRRFAREDVSAVTIERGFVTIRDAQNRSNKLSVMNAVNSLGQARAERTQRQIQRWVEQRPAPVADPAQIPGSASI